MLIKIMIIATTGMGGCGKGEVLKYLEKKGFRSVVMRTVVEDEMRRKGVEVNNKNLREYATKMRKEKGMDVVAKMCVPIIRNLLKNEKAILVDGVRSYEEVELYRKEFGNDFILIAIFAPLKLRFERLKKRGREWDMRTLDELKWRDEVELGWGTGKSITLADFMVDNSGSLENLQRQIDKIIPCLGILPQHH